MRTRAADAASGWSSASGIRCALQESARENAGIVVLTATDSSPEFEELIANWICHVQHAHVSSPVVWSLDAVTHRKLLPNSNVRSVFTPSISLPNHSNPNQYKRPAWNECAQKEKLHAAT